MPNVNIPDPNHDKNQTIVKEEMLYNCKRSIG